MAKRISGILLEGVPEDADALTERLSAVSDALHKKRTTKGLSRTEERVWTQLLDYWHHLECLSGAHEAPPVTDPLALLDLAEKFNLAKPEKIIQLRAEFTRRAEKIVGHPLKPQQVRQLYQLMTGFNPAQP